MSMSYLGLAYGIMGTSYLVAGFAKRKLKILTELSTILLSLAAFNIYIDECKNCHGQSFVGTTTIIIFVFGAARTYWLNAMLRQVRLKHRFWFWEAALPIMWVLLFSILSQLPKIDTLENPPLVVYCFVVLAWILQAPMYIAGLSKAATTINSSISSLDLDIDATKFLRTALLALIIPTCISFFVQIMFSDDWRLFFFNLTLIFTDLLLIGITVKKASCRVVAGMTN
jgi:hypothetical protein